MKNEFYVVGDEVFIKLRNFIAGANDPSWTIIDLVDFDLVNKFHHYWKIIVGGRDHNDFYAAHTKSTGIGKNIYILLHNVIMNITPRTSTLEVDHKNINSLDNRRNNLRKVTRQINSFNKTLNKNNKDSGITGVCKHKATGRWRAYINLNYKQIYLGVFYTKEEAIQARLKAEDVYKI